MEGWDSFFVAQVGASAALAGPVFISISINLQRILAFKNLPGRAFEALALLLTVLVTASLLLVPSQGATIVGIEVLAIGLVIWLIVVTIQIRGFKYY